MMEGMQEIFTRSKHQLTTLTHTQEEPDLIAAGSKPESPLMAIYRDQKAMVYNFSM